MSMAKIFLENKNLARDFSADVELACQGPTRKCNVAVEAFLYLWSVSLGI